VTLESGGRRTIVALGIGDAVITNDMQYRATKAHLATFDQAAAILEATLAAGDAPRLTQLELDAVRAQADDLRAEIEEYGAMAGL
jgi:hypothetical protein